MLSDVLALSAQCVDAQTLPAGFSATRLFSTTTLSAPTALDVDGNGLPDALTDGLLIIRYFFGLRGPELIQGAIVAGAVRQNAAQVEPCIQNLLR